MDDDLIARVYLTSSLDAKVQKKAEEAIKSNPRYVPPLGQQRSSPMYQRGDREPTEEPDECHVPYLEVRFSDIPRTKLGLVFGSSEKCDVYLPIKGVTNTHFALTFDEQNHLIVETWDSLMGLEVTYENKKGLTQGYGIRRNFRWIVGGADVPQGMTSIIISVLQALKFQIVPAHHDIESPAYVNKVERFRQGAATTEDLLDDFALSGRLTEPATGAQTPGEGTIYLRKKLGEGSFGVVTHHWDVSTGNEFALKEPPAMTRRKRIVDTDAWKREASIMRKLDHRHIVKLLGFHEGPQPHLYLEYVSHGSLSQYDDISPQEALLILSQCLSALVYLHGQRPPVAHRDIKPDNILVQHRFAGYIEVKFGDFGLAKDSYDLKTFCGSRSYIAPEILGNTEGKTYDLSIDVWSLGVVTCELLCGLPPYRTEYGTAGALWCELIIQHFERDYSCGPDDLKRFLLNAMVVLSRRWRWSAQECSNHVEQILVEDGSRTPTPSSYAEEGAEYDDTITRQPSRIADDEDARETIIWLPSGTAEGSSAVTVDSRRYIRSGAPAPSTPSASTTSRKRATAAKASLSSSSSTRKRSLKPSSSSSGRHKRHQSLEHNLVECLRDPLHPLRGGSSFSDELRLEQSTYSSVAPTPAVDDPASLPQVASPKEEQLFHRSGGVSSESDPYRATGGAGYAGVRRSWCQGRSWGHGPRSWGKGRSWGDGEESPDHGQTIDGACDETHIATQLWHILDNERQDNDSRGLGSVSQEDDNAHVESHSATNYPASAANSAQWQPTAQDLGAMPNPDMNDGDADGPAVNAAVSLQETGNAATSLPRHSPHVLPEASHLSTRDLLFDREGLVYMVLRRQGVSMRLSDFQLNANQILKAANTEASKRRTLLGKLKSEGIIRDGWVPFRHGAFLSQAVGLEDELRPLFSYANLDIPSREDNYLLGRRLRRIPLGTGAENGFAGLWCGECEIAYQPSKQMINITHILKAGNIPRWKLCKYLTDNPTATEKIAAGDSRRLGTYASYEYAIGVCNHFNLGLAPVRGFLAESILNGHTCDAEALFNGDRGTNASAYFAWPDHDLGPVIGMPTSHADRLPGWNRSHHSNFTEATYGNGSYLAPRNQSFMQLLE